MLRFPRSAAGDRVIDRHDRLHVSSPSYLPSAIRPTAPLAVPHSTRPAPPSALPRRRRVNLGTSDTTRLLDPPRKSLSQLARGPRQASGRYPLKCFCRRAHDDSPTQHPAARPSFYPTHFAPKVGLSTHTRMFRFTSTQPLLAHPPPHFHPPHTRPIPPRQPCPPCSCA